MLTRDELKDTIRTALIQASQCWETMPDPRTFQGDKLKSIESSLLNKLETTLMNYEKFKKPERFSYKGIF